MSASEARSTDRHPYGREVRPPDLEGCRSQIELARRVSDDLDDMLGNSAQLDHARFLARRIRRHADQIHDELTHYQEEHHD